MADAKITELTALTPGDPADLLPVVHDPTGMALTQKMTIATLLGIVTGDITINGSGQAAIGPNKVLSSMIANGAGVAALLAAGLGGSAKVLKTSAGAIPCLTPNPTQDRACIVVLVVDETYDEGTGTLPTVLLAYADPDHLETAVILMANTVLTNQVAGTVLTFAFVLPAVYTLGVGATAKVGDATGGCSVVAWALPTSSVAPTPTPTPTPAP